MNKAEIKSSFKRRVYQLVIKVLKLLENLPKDEVTRVLINQLTRSITSILANYIEGQAASSRKDFTNFMHHCLKSANESKVWVSILKDLKKIPEDEAKLIMLELKEISNVLGASLMTLKKNPSKA